LKKNILSESWVFVYLPSFSIFGVMTGCVFEHLESKLVYIVTLSTALEHDITSSYILVILVFGCLSLHSLTLLLKHKLVLRQVQSIPILTQHRIHLLTGTVRYFHWLVLVLLRMHRHQLTLNIVGVVVLILTSNLGVESLVVEVVVISFFRDYLNRAFGLGLNVWGLLLNLSNLVWLKVAVTFTVRNSFRILN
jgi:hypothetical protein